MLHLYFQDPLLHQLPAVAVEVRKVEQVEAVQADLEK